MNIDLVIFNFINGFAGKWFFADSLFYVLSSVLPYLLLVPFAYLLIKGIKKNGVYVLEVFISAFFARYGLCQAIRQFFPRERPFIALNDVNLLAPFKDSASLPSGHVSFFFALSTVVFLYNKKAGTVFYTLSFLIGLSRVYIGLHWPSDILAGIFVGLLSGVIIYGLAQLFKKNKKKPRKQ